MKVQSSSVTVVLVGNFRPADFLPDKLVDSKLLTYSVSETQIQALLPDQVAHYVLGWAEIRVTRSRLHIGTTEVPYVRVCDLVLSSAGNASPGFLVSAFGINCEYHYDLGSNDKRNVLGTNLAPPSAWGAWGMSLSAAMTGDRKGTVMQSGMLSLQMRCPFTEDDVEGTLDVTVGPSMVVPNNAGVYFRSNRHHQVVCKDIGEQTEAMRTENTNCLLAALGRNFDLAVTEAESIFEGVLSQ